MSTELWLLSGAIILGFLQIFLQSHSASLQRGYRWNAGARDEQLPPVTGAGGRLERALKNFLETFPFFAAAVLMAELRGVHNGLTLWGAWLYLGGRIAYVPLYGYGVRYVRSLAWNVAIIGILLILAGVVLAA
jgi:uncharacterized MAPEG superfamily protein